MKEKRDETIILRLSKTEKNRIYEKMLSMGIRSLSAYIRKMALDGYCLNLDLPQLRRMAYLLQMRLLSQRILTGNTFTIILFTTPLR